MKRVSDEPTARLVEPADRQVLTRGMAEIDGLLSVRRRIPGHKCPLISPPITNECGTLPHRGVFDKSHNHQASSARRLVIEAIYSL